MSSPALTKGIRCRRRLRLVAMARRSWNWTFFAEMLTTCLASHRLTRGYFEQSWTGRCTPSWEGRTVGLEAFYATINQVLDLYDDGTARNTGSMT